MQNEWTKVECSIIMDKWADKRNRPFINIMVSCPRGPYFFRSIDCSLKEKMPYSSKRYYVRPLKMLDRPTLCVITDATPVCKVAGMIVQNKNRHISWNPCFVYAMNNVLKDFSKFSSITPIIEKGKEIQMFVCNHHQAQAIYRLHAKVDLLKPVDTRYGTYFILLH
eukprot:Gb_01306 [translate_table: standard]